MTVSSAFHEAGHAVAADAFGRRVDGLSIEPCGRLGGLCWSSAPSDPPVTLEQMEAARRARGRHDPGSDLAYRLVWGSIRAHRAEVERMLAIALAGPVAQRMACGGPYDWVSGADDLRTALALVGGPDGHRDFFAALEKAEALLTEHWPTVQRLAARLWLHGRLDGEQIAEIFPPAGKFQAAA